MPRVLDLLLGQGAASVWLWIPPAYVRFPEWSGALPDVPEDMEIRRAPFDAGPATKFLFAMDKISDDRDLLICDDDTEYGAGWLEAFRKARLAHPQAALTGSSFPVSRILTDAGTGSIAQGFAGTMFRRKMLLPLKIPPVFQWVDDIWLSANFAATGADIVTIDDARAAVQPQPAQHALQYAVIGGKSRAALNRNAAEVLSTQFSIWQKRRQ